MHTSFSWEWCTCVFWGRRGSIGTRLPVLVSVLICEPARCQTSWRWTSKAAEERPDNEPVRLRFCTLESKLLWRGQVFKYSFTSSSVCTALNCSMLCSHNHFFTHEINTITNKCFSCKREKKNSLPWCLVYACTTLKNCGSKTWLQEHVLDSGIAT